MALIFCPECGTQVSEHAQQCNKCAYPISKLKACPSQNNTISSNANVIYRSPEENEASSGLIVSGYIVASLSLLIFPAIFLMAGIIVGIITISKGSTSHGIIHIVLSVVLASIGASIGGWGIII